LVKKVVKNNNEIIKKMHSSMYHQIQQMRGNIAETMQKAAETSGIACPFIPDVEYMTK